MLSDEEFLAMMRDNNTTKPEATSMDSNAALDEVNEIFYTPSIDKKRYISSGQMVPAETAVYQGNFISKGTGFISNLSEGVGRGIILGGAQHIAQAIGNAGARMNLIGAAPAEDPNNIGDVAIGAFKSTALNMMGLGAPQIRAMINKSDIEGAETIGQAAFGNEKIFANKLRNFGLYLEGHVNRVWEGREAEKPIQGTVGGFVGNVLSSILLSLGLSAVGGTQLPAMYFASQAGEGSMARSLEVGNDIKSSLAYGILNAAPSYYLEKLGLDNIMLKTYTKGSSIWLRKLASGMLGEGVTEALQQSVEIGVDIASGARKNVTLMGYLSEIGYAAAAGMLAGGGMVSAVTMRQQHVMRQMLIKSGMRTQEATRFIKETTPEVADAMLSDMSKDVGFSDIDNEIYQRAVDKTNLNYFANIVAGNGRVMDQELQQQIDELGQYNPAVQTLNTFTREAEATARMEAEEAKQSTLPSDKEQRKAQRLMQLDREVPISEKPEPAEPRFPADMTPERKLIVRGRIKTLNDQITQTKQKLREQEAELGSEAAVNEEYNKAEEKLASLELERDILREYPGMIDIEGKDIKVNAREVLNIAGRRVQQLAKTAGGNLKRGQVYGKKEFNWIKTNVKRFINQKGLTKERRAMLYKRYVDRMDTIEKFYDVLPMLQSDIDQALKESYIGTFKQGIAAIVENVLKGTGKDTKRTVNFTLETQRAADIFLAAYSEKTKDNISASDAWAQLDGSSLDSKMRFLGAQLREGRNPIVGRDLTVEEYSRMYNQIREFAASGVEQATFQKRANEIKNQMLTDQIRTEAQRPQDSAGINKIWDRILGFAVPVTRLYDTTISMIFRGVGNTIGGSVGEKIMNFNNEMRIADLYRLKYDSHMLEEAKRIFGLKTNNEVMEKLNSDSRATPDNSVRVLIKGEEVILPRAVAREKKMLWRRPEGRTKMEAQGWTEESFIPGELTNGDYEYIESQLQVFSDLYELINAAYSKQKGYDLPRSEFYSQILFEGDLEHANVFDTIFTPKGSKSDIGNTSMLKKVTTGEVRLKDVPDFLKLKRYIRDATYYSAMAEKLTMVQHIFSDKDLIDTIDSRFGKGVMRSINRYIQVLSRNSTSSDTDKLLESTNKFVTRLGQGFIAAKGTVALKQLTSFATAMAEMSPAQYVKGMMDLPAAIADGRAKYLFGHGFFVDRYQARTIDRDFRYIQDTLDLKMINDKKLQVFDNPKLNAILFLPTMFGDAGGAALSAWPVFQHYINDLGMSPAEARVKTIERVKKTQQSKDYTEVSAVSLRPDPISRLFTMFTQTTLQYINQVYEQLNTIGTDRFDPMDFARMYAVYFIILPQLFGFIARGFKFPDRDEAITSTILGPMNSVPFFGQALEHTVMVATQRIDHELTGKRIDRNRRSFYGIGLFDSYIKNYHDTVEALDDVIAGRGIGPEEFFELIKRGTEISMPFTGGVGGAARVAAGGIEGIYRAVDGGFAENWRRYLMLLGFSEYQTRQ